MQTSRTQDFNTNRDNGFGVVANDISYIKRDVAEIKEKLENDYVSKSEFAPVRNLVYGLVGVAGVTIIGAVLKLILRM